MLYEIYIVNNTLIFLRHAETQKSETIPISKWILTKEGKKKSLELMNSSIFDTVDIILSSKEIKAYQTVLPLSKRLNKKIKSIPNIGEINRDAGKVMTKDEYDKAKTKIFENLDFTTNGWETSRHALNRFEKMIKKINSKYSNKKILIASHGTVMTLYFARKQSKMNELMKRWKSLGFLDYGIIKNNKVVKDVV